MAHPLYGKKKKKLPKCPNPLFLMWLTEWRDEAAEKGAKSQYTYGKALKSLQKFPLELKTGKDCKILENFGDKICKMLDDKLSEYIAKNGSAVITTESSSDDDYGSIGNTIPERLVGQDKNGIQHQGKVVALVRQRAPVHELSDSDGEQEPQQPARKRQRSGRGGEREYVPTYRSGPYAILLTLYRDMQLEDSRGFMTKTEIVRDAQKLADKSFTFPDPNSRYTSWSSMGTLIKKGLVIKESSPAKYSLTDAGCELAHRLEAVDKENEGMEAPYLAEAVRPAAASPARLNPPSLPKLPDLVNEEPAFSNSESTGSLSRLQYWYIAENGSETLQKDRASVTVEDEIGVGFLVKCNYRELLKSGLQYKLDTSRPIGDDFVYAYLSNDDTEEFAIPPTTSQSTGPKGKGSKSTISSKKNNSGKTILHDKPQLLPLKHSDSSTSVKQTDIVVLDSEESSLDSVSGPVSYHQALTASVPGLMDRISGKSRGGSSVLPRTVSADSQESSQGSIKSLSSMSSGVSVKTLPDPDFVLRPGEFDIIVCVDNAEFYGASKGNSKTLLPDLIKNGVDCHLRKLHVGDILWIAKEKTEHIPGQLGQPQGRELVLNYIIERKRMDDLVSSCLDGRFKEQKFRLKKCGLPNAMYLIEDYGSMQHFSIPETTIKQAITNTQVIDGFQVKRTKDSKETVAFLTVFTRYLQSSFKHKTLYACGLDKLRESDLTYSIGDTEQRLPTFEEFNQSSVKTKALTVQEMLGKQLIQLHGMSAEKARAVTEKYPTPTSLIQAYNSCTDSRAKEMLLAPIKCGKSARSLGQAQSKQISQLYNTHSALT